MHRVPGPRKSRPKGKVGEGKDEKINISKENKKGVPKSHTLLDWKIPQKQDSKELEGQGKPWILKKLMDQRTPTKEVGEEGCD